MRKLANLYRKSYFNRVKKYYLIKWKDKNKRLIRLQDKVIELKRL